MSVVNAERASEGALKFKIEQVNDGVIADMTEAVATLRPQNPPLRIPNTVIQHVADFETRWRPILNYLELLKMAGDHISEVSHFFPFLFAKLDDMSRFTHLQSWPGVPSRSSRRFNHLFNSNLVD